MQQACFRCPYPRRSNKPSCKSRCYRLHHHHHDLLAHHLHHHHVPIHQSSHGELVPYHAHRAHHFPIDCSSAFPAPCPFPFSHSGPQNEATLQNLCLHGRLDSAADFVSRMQVPLSPSTCRSLLKECSKNKSVALAKQVHAHLYRFAVDIKGSLGDYLVATLAYCGAIEDARVVCRNLHIRTVFSWTALITAYVDQGCGQEALSLYECMQADSVEPSSYTFVSLFRACGSTKNLEKGNELHRYACRKGLVSDVFVCTALLSMYSKFGAVAEAEEVFMSLPELDVVSCNAMLSAYVEQGQGEKALLLYRQIHEEGAHIDHLTVVAALQACAMLGSKKVTSEDESIDCMALEIGQALHADAKRKGYSSNGFLCSALVSMYGACWSSAEAGCVLSDLLKHDAVAWNALLSTCVQRFKGEMALQLYVGMEKEGVSPNHLTFVIILQACGILGGSLQLMSLEFGHAMHTDAIGKGYTSDIRVGTAFINMYNKCGRILEAQAVFCAMPLRDVVSWNAMLTTLLEHGQEKNALRLYRQMQEEGIKTNELSLMIATQACGILADAEETVILKERLLKAMSFEIGQALHADARRVGYVSDVMVANSILGMYGHCGAMKEAEHVFGAQASRDVVTWNVMLAAYAEQGQYDIMLQMFGKMQDEQVYVDDGTLTCILQACDYLGSLETLKHVHFSTTCASLEVVSSVASSLLHAYGGCASMEDCQTAFNSLFETDIVSWNAIIDAYAGGGDSIAGLHVMEKLMQAGYMPNEISFSSTLVACSRTGLVIEGLEYLESMLQVYGMTLDMTHYSNVLDILGRAGDFKRMESLLGRMPAGLDMSKLLGMLGACRVHGNVALATHTFEQAVNLQPDRTAAYVLMSNIYADLELHYDPVQ